MEIHKTLAIYLQALERLVNGKPLNVPKGTQITLKSVSLEAGRSGSSIKKSRPEFLPLIEKINEAELKQNKSDEDISQTLEKLKLQLQEYRILIDGLGEDNQSLLVELLTVRRELSALTGGNVFPIRPKL
ncbi:MULTISPECIES: hypothetical protein [Bacteria]|jgi:hypothetical protein|uniref:Uncharacterized protein n=1 Tax=Merismopedia glauca CCAP 1448/3 TaxID=1296344 RepID=A0A2T1C5W4_9CYAN|nr:hypothetical protein [Merismopedia glauca]PSB03624.1 hypothetical protein C7B64_07760 [Merismopedia glauca CCAP 1448/3]